MASDPPSSAAAAATPSGQAPLYHMVEEARWRAAKESGAPYYPPTYEQARTGGKECIRKQKPAVNAVQLGMPSLPITGNRPGVVPCYFERTCPPPCTSEDNRVLVPASAEALSSRWSLGPSNHSNLSLVPTPPPSPTPQPPNPQTQDGFIHLTAWPFHPLPLPPRPRPRIGPRTPTPTPCTPHRTASST